MAQAKQIFIVCADGTNQIVDGKTAIFDFGGRKLRAFIHGKTLTHYASGRRICDLRPYQILLFRSYRRVPDREAAKLALQDLADKVGADKAWQIMDSAPVINGGKHG